MAAPFRRRRSGGVALALRAQETAVLRGLLTDLDGLLEQAAPEDDDVPADPLEALVGLGGPAAERPTDPALLRLFPDAVPDDDEASAEMRRYTQPGLVQARRERVATVLPTLDGGRAGLTGEQARAWLGALNDLRLVLGERLEVGEDLEEQLAALAPDDPRAGAFAVYDWLGWAQESLLRALR